MASLQSYASTVYSQAIRVALKQVSQTRALLDHFTTAQAVRRIRSPLQLQQRQRVLEISAAQTLTRTLLLLHIQWLSS